MQTLGDYRDPHNLGHSSKDVPFFLSRSKCKGKNSGKLYVSDGDTEKNHALDNAKYFESDFQTILLANIFSLSFFSLICWCKNLV